MLCSRGVVVVVVVAAAVNKVSQLEHQRACNDPGVKGAREDRAIPGVRNSTRPCFCLPPRSNEARALMRGI